LNEEKFFRGTKMKLDIREKIALFMGVCFSAMLLWHLFLYGPQKKDLERIKEEQKLIQTQYDRLLEDFSSAMLGSAEKIKISRKCIEILKNLPRKEEIGFALSQIMKTGESHDIRIISMTPQKLSFSESQDTKTESQLEKIFIDMIMEGRFIDMGQYLFDLVELPFFAGCSKIGIETAKEIYPETRAKMTCVLLFIKNNT
jgi:Tfp pilus assembly protein PilO